MPHELFVTQDKQLKYVITYIANNKSTDIKLSKDQILKLWQESVIVFLIMANFQEASVKLTNTQLSKLKSAAKNKTGTRLSLNKRNFEDEELSHELFLTTRHTTKIRDALKPKH